MTRTRILASGDHHFDEHTRFEECCRIHDWMVEIAAREQVDLFLSGGDIYERASTPLERKAVGSWLTKMAEVCPVVLAKGNHDRHHELHIIGRLRTSHAIVVEEQAGVHIVGGVGVAAVAWPDRAELAAAAGVGASGQAVDDLAGDALRAVLRGLGTQLDGFDGPRVLLGHFMVNGSLASTGQPLLGMPISIGLTDLSLAHCHFGVLGHIHTAQEWVHGEVPYAYTGSPFRTDFGQTEEKSVVLIEFDGNRLVRWERIPTPATPMILLEGAWDPALRRIEIETEQPHSVTGAEVRLRYSVDAEHRHTARSAAAELRQGMIELGAANVKIEESVSPTAHARVPEIATAKTLREKLEHMWRSQGKDPGDRREPILSKLAEIEAALGAFSAQQQGQQCRLESVKFHNLGDFEDFELNLLDYPQARTIAITGPNGAGKSTVLGLSIPGAVHRETPRHGTLLSLARSRRDSWLESKISGWRIRHLLDGIGNKGESLVLDENDRPVLKTGKVTEFDAWAKRTFPCKEVLLKTIFAPQGVETFIKLKPGPRKAVLLRAIGVEKLEAFAQFARDRAKDIRKDIATLEARIADERTRGVPIEEATAELAQAQAAMTTAEEQLTAARSALADALALAEKAAEVTRQRGAIEEQRTQLAARLGPLCCRREELNARVASLKTIIGNADKIRATAARIEELRTLQVAADSHRREAESQREHLEREVQQARARVQDARQQCAAYEARTESLAERRKDIVVRIENNREILTEAEQIRKAVADVARLIEDLHRKETEIATQEAERTRATSQIASLEQVAAALRTRIGDLTKRLEFRGAVEDAVAELPGAEYTERTREEALEAAEAELRTLQAETITGIEGRVSILRSGLQTIAQGEDPYAAREVAIGTLATDDDAVVCAAEHPCKIRTANDVVALRRAQLAEARKHTADVRAVAARQSDMVTAAADLEADERRLRETLESIESERAAEQAARCRIGHLLTDRLELRGQWESSNVLAKRAEPLSRAEARLSELDTQLAALDREIAEHVANPVSPVPPLEELRSGSALMLVGVTLSAIGAGARYRAAGEQLLAIDGGCSVDDLLRAETTLNEIQPQLSAIESEISTLEATVIPDAPEIIVVPDRAQLQQQVESAEQRKDGAGKAVARAEVSLGSAATRAQRLDTLTIERTDAEAQVADWNRLGEDLGRDGLQALEIDAAGPELNTLVNDLLHSCHGTRFTVDLRTTRLSGDGKDELDGCEINVVDTEKGGDREASEYSDGEQVIIGEAFALGLTMLACKNAGINGPTLVRDETGAALDSENARAYVAMLRRAADLLGANHVLFVSHSKEVQDLADVRIAIAPRTVERPDEQLTLSAA